MSDEEIMRKFNEQFSNNTIDGDNKKENNPTPYKVGENLNNMVNENTIKVPNSVKNDPSLNPVNNVVNYNNSVIIITYTPKPDTNGVAYQHVFTNISSENYTSVCDTLKNYKSEIKNIGKNGNNGFNSITFN